MPFVPAQSETHIIADYSVLFVKAGVPFPIPITGEDGQSFFTYSRNTEAVKQKVDLSGRGVFSVSANKSGKIEFNIMHTSTFIATFQSLIAVVSPIGELDTAGTFDVHIKDNQGREFLTGLKCKIEKPSDGDRGGEVNVYKYTVLATQLLINEQGLVIDLV